MSDAPAPSPSRARVILGVGLIALGVVAVNTGVDIVLPAVPSLPEALGGDTATAQFVLAGYMAGAFFALIALGWLGDHFDRRAIFAVSIALFAALSFAAAFANNISTLIMLRVLQGMAASGPGVVMAGMIRDLTGEKQAVRAMGFLGSVQSLVPALAPIAGAYLTVLHGWASTFVATGIFAGVAFLLILVRPQLLPAGRSASSDTMRHSYSQLLRNPLFLRHAFGYGLVLGGLVIFVFSAPVLIVKTMNGTILDFVLLQVVGILTFMVTANTSSVIVTRFGSDRVIITGTLLALLSAIAFLVYGLMGGKNPWWLIPLWIPMNIGIGLRGPASFVAAINAAGKNDARASALIGMILTLLWAVGTAAVAPFLIAGLVSVAIAMVVIIAPAVVLEIIKPGSPAATT